jgi:hypothetical protein
MNWNAASRSIRPFSFRNALTTSVGSFVYPSTVVPRLTHRSSSRRPRAPYKRQTLQDLRPTVFYKGSPSGHAKGTPGPYPSL